MRRTSLVWEDTRAQLREHPELIDVPARQIEAGSVLVAVDTGRAEPVGFAVVLPRDDGDVELDGLFTEPARFREGIGTALVCAVEAAAVEKGAQRVHVTANRNALGFYQALGFETVAEVATQLGPIAALMQKPLAARWRELISDARLRPPCAPRPSRRSRRSRRSWSGHRHR